MLSPELIEDRTMLERARAELIADRTKFELAEKELEVQAEVIRRRSNAFD